MDIPPSLAGDDRLYFEDVKVGQRFVTGTHALDAAQIKAFAGEFDPQPFHLDEAAAEHSLFGGLAASGWHTAAITMKLLVKAGLRIAGGLVGGQNEITWPQPTRPGDVLRVEGEILETMPSKSRPDRGFAIMQTLTVNQRGETLQKMTAKLIVPRRDP